MHNIAANLQQHSVCAVVCFGLPIEKHACRGLDNRVYYMLAPEGQYYNYSGCGNTVNCNHPLVRRFILDALRYWVAEMHVDGFRFDLGSIMTRTHSLWHPPSSLGSSPAADALTPQGEALRLVIASP